VTTRLQARRTVRFDATVQELFGVHPMPTYSYRCEKCGKNFDRVETMSEHEAAKPQCLKCGSKKVSAVPGNQPTID
jgi:putative FmdB family regulatory protein